MNRDEGGSPMHSHSMQRWTHDHVFLGRDHDRNARRTWMVVGLTAAMMLVEIAAGLAFGSMALLADGVHMMTHAGALTIAAAAYAYARRHARDPSFSFGTGKVGDLASFASAIVLGVVALLVAYESVMRLYSPTPILFDQAILVATVGLAVNVASAWILGSGGHQHDHGHHHHHDHGHSHDHDHDDHDHSDHAHHNAHDSVGQDHNLRAAYVHVLADAATSVLAITALLSGRYLGLTWLDPLMGIAGAVLIGQWSVGLMRASGAVLTDAIPDPHVAESIRERLEVGDDRIADLHLWRVGPGHTAVVIAIVSDEPREPDHYKQRLRDLTGLSHVTVEVQRCPHGHGVEPDLAA
jgi:cation diffusion facilitator family transporter